MNSSEGKKRDAEPDRLDGFPAPRETRRLFGHAEAQGELIAAARSERMPPAWLLSGPTGIGKATLAFAIARLLFRGPAAIADAGDLDNCAEDAVFTQTASLAYPNLFLLRRSWDDQGKRWKQIIAVDDVRRLRNFLAGAAGRRGWRVVIVDSADHLNDSSANALLKSIEEPPARTVFLLCADAPGQLPVTIRSRCRALPLTPLLAEELRQAADQAMEAAGKPAPKPLDRETADKLAEGSVRRALMLYGEGIQLYRSLIQILQRLPAFDAARTHALAETLAAPAAQDRFEIVYGLLLDLIARLTRQSATGHGALDAEEAALARGLIPPDRLARWAELWETLSRAKADAVEFNLPKRSLLLDTFFRFSEIARDRAA